MLNKKLQAVNQLLKAIGEPSLIEEADYALSEEARLAEEQIEYTLNSVLSEGFKFNTLTSTLLPDISGFIGIPASALVVEFTDSELTVNDGMVFNRSDFTNKFTEGVEASIVYSVAFEEIPYVLQNLIIAEASIIFQRDSINDTSNTDLHRVKQEAQFAVNVWKIKQAKANAVDSRFSRSANPTSSR